MPKKPEKKSDEFNFNEAYAELEKIVAWFERDDLDLEEGLKKFERGLELAKRCKERLNQVSRNVEEISAKFGDLAKEPKGARLGGEADGEPNF